MSVKVAMPRDIESSFNSSITMPDTVTGEVEWQEESQRIFQSANITVSDGVFIDAVYVDENSGPTGGSGLFVLSGNLPSGYRVKQYNQSGGVIREIVVPTPQPSGGSHQAISLSLVNGNILYVARAQYTTSWSFSYVMYSLITFGSLTQVAQISNKFNNYPENSYFRIKTNRLETAVIANNPQGNAGVTVFNSSSQEISSTGQTYSDIAITESEIYALANAPVTVTGGFVTRVSVLRFDLSNIRTIDFERLTGSWSRPIINYGISQVTHGVEHTFQKVYVQAYDKNMVNIGSYKRNDEVIKSSTKRKYRCAVDATFDDPELGVNLSPPTWADIGSVNRFAALDSNTSQRSIFNGGGFVSCSITSPVDTVGIFGLSGVQSATVSVISGGSTLYTETKSGVDYEFSDVEIRDIIFSIPPFSNVTIRVDFTGSNVRVGRFAVGVSETMGRAVSGTELGDIDYSILEFDKFGNTRYAPRPIVSFHTFQVDVDKQKSLSVARKLQSIGGKDAMWSADVGLSEPLVAIGKCERFPITYDDPTIVSYTVKVRGTA